MLADLVRLILLILFLPLILILIGPLLILAVWRGHQPMGPIMLDTSRYSPVGRVSAFGLGVVLWLLVWGSLAWLMFTAFSPVTILTALSPSAPATVALPETATPTPIPPTPTLVTIVELTSSPATPTPLSVISTPTQPAPSPTPSETPTPPSVVSTPTQPAPSPTPSDTPTPLVPTVTSTSTPEPSPSATPTSSLETLTPVPLASPTIPLTRPNNGTATATRTISPQATLTVAERKAVAGTVEEGNILLREAITDASPEKLQQMETIWRGLALQVARNFAVKIHEQYAKPVQVQFEYLEPPTVDQASARAEVTVTSRERWSYGGPTQTDKEEVFDFIYTLAQEDGRWLIIRYTYRNVSATSTPIPTPSPAATPAE